MRDYELPFNQLWGIVFLKQTCEVFFFLEKIMNKKRQKCEADIQWLIL